MGLACRLLAVTIVLRLLGRHAVVAQDVNSLGSITGNSEGSIQTEQQPDIDDTGAPGNHFKFRGREWHPESFGHTKCSNPIPKINSSGNIFDCLILRNVCLDQGVIIYQDSRYHPWTSEARLPHFNITDILWNTPSVLGIGDKWKSGKNRYQFPLMRPWHHMEESEDVRRPVFSNCTTPLHFFHHFPFNVAEVYRFAVNNIYFMQQRLHFFDDHITLVPGNPPMSAVPSFTRFWLQPFSKYAVTSMGALSQRWPAGSPPPPSAATGEGEAVRCFSRFIMCKITLKKPTAAFFEAGQFVANYYADKAQPFTANYTQRLTAEVPLEDQQDDAVLKVVFAVRSKSHKDIGRMLLNEDELIERCNRQELTFPTDPTVSIFRRVRCFRHIFGVDNLYDMWLVRHADVLVGVHGSALTNAMFMRQGSSVIELRPYGFSGRESWPNIYMKSQTRNMEVFWFGIDVMNASLSSPGDFEADMQPIYTRAKGCLARDRNLIVPWKAMAHQLLNIAVASRNIWRYKVLRYSHSYYITHDIQPLELRGRDKRVPLLLQTWFKDPDEERRRAAAIPLTPEGAQKAAAEEEALMAKALAAQEARAAQDPDPGAQDVEGHPLLIPDTGRGGEGTGGKEQQQQSREGGGHHHHQQNLHAHQRRQAVGARGRLREAALTQRRDRARTAARVRQQAEAEVPQAQAQVMAKANEAAGVANEGVVDAEAEKAVAKTAEATAVAEAEVTATAEVLAAAVTATR